MAKSTKIAASKKRPRLTRGDLVLRAVAIVAAGAFISIVALSLPSAGRVLALATTKQPEPFTELYFSDHLHLPKQVEAGHVTSVTYHITNHEAEASVYHPRVTLFEDGQPHLLSQTTLTLVDGQGQDLTTTFVATQAGTSLELVIDLPDQHQSIHFRSRS